MWPDIVNGTFEFIGAAVLWLNVVQLCRDRVIRGVHWVPTAFFSAWGLWNLYFYPHLGQLFSLAGAIALVSVNLMWLVLVIRYRAWRSAL